MTKTLPPAWKGIVLGLCPRCRRGPIFNGSIFRGFPRMHRACPVCDLRYEREPGYFLGAMYISYGLAVPLMVLFFLLFWRLTEWRFTTLMLASFLALLPFTPGLTLLSRVLWIYLDQKIDPQN
ncbi:MAG: DUF983 domain-containing protein [Terriglobales bacterium]